MSHVSWQTDEVMNQFKRSVILRKWTPSLREGLPTKDLASSAHTEPRTVPHERGRSHLHFTLLYFRICKWCRASRRMWNVGAECI